MTPSFRKYKAHADIRGGSPGWGHQMTVGLSTTAIFGDLGGYFFGNATDKTSNNTWRYAIPCRPIIDKSSDIDIEVVVVSMPISSFIQTKDKRRLGYQIEFPAPPPYTGRVVKTADAELQVPASLEKDTVDSDKEDICHSF